MRGGETTMARALAKQGSAPSCKDFAKCRRADNMISGIEISMQERT